MKKITTILVLILAFAVIFSGCTSAKDDVVIKVGTLAGPTGMGMAKIIDEGAEKYEVSIYTAPDQLLPKIIKGELDICAVPSNVASVLYKKTDKKIEALSINTTGVLYILENGDTINSIADLKGKTINSSGQGASPEYILNNILEKNGLVIGEDVEVVYHSEHANLANLVASGEIEIAVLPEPFVSVVTAKNKDINVQLDFNDLWHDLYGEDVDMPMGVTIVQKAFLKDHPKAVEQFMKDYKASIEFVNSDIDAAAEIISANKIVPSPAIAKSAIPRCGIVFIEKDGLKSTLENYYEVLKGYNPASIGGTLPDEEFYYND